MALDRPTVRAPEFPAVAWLNAPAPLSLAALRGQVLLIEIWDFSCINCLRTLPALREWHRRYQIAGLTAIGVHTPEFPFGQDAATVQRALRQLGVRWPVALDNEQLAWTAWANHVWPTVYLVDRNGYVRYRREGEGGYREIEAAFRALLLEGSPTAEPLPEWVFSDTDGEEGKVCLPATPELQVESVVNGLPREGESTHFRLPADRREGVFYLEGEWRLAQRGLTLLSPQGEIALPFQAGAVHAVLEAGRMEGGDRNEAWLEVSVDGEKVPAGEFGQDLRLREGAAWLLVDGIRCYETLRSIGPGLHELRLRLVTSGTTLYAFSFSAACDPVPQLGSESC